MDVLHGAHAVMSKHFWILIISIGFFTSLGHAQEAAQHEQRQEKTEPASTQGRQLPFPVEIVENKAKADARQGRENEARQRDMRGLSAQESMNTATQAIKDATLDMRNYALYSNWLVAIGTGLLVATLWLTRQANRAAQNAVEVTREIGEAQIRAYVNISSVDATSIQVGTNIPIKVGVKNYGATPAREFAYVGKPHLVPPEKIESLGLPDLSYLSPGSDLAPNDNAFLENTLIDVPLDDESIGLINEGTLKFVLVYYIKYKDIFDKQRITKCILTAQRIGNTNNYNFAMSRVGNEST